LTDLKEPEQEDLVNLMLKYITFDVVDEHVRLSRTPDPEMDIHENRELFFEWHDQYIAKMENFLLDNGGKGFVPLPIWNATKPIPKSFMVHKQLPFPNEAQGELQNPGHPQNGFRPGGILDPSWIPPLICIADSVDHTSFTAIINFHGRVHGQIRGVMAGFASPCAPIFYNFHGFLVQLYKDWKEKCRI
jgi:hypothetical protein